MHRVEWSGVQVALGLEGRVRKGSKTEEAGFVVV